MVLSNVTILVNIRYGMPYLVGIPLGLIGTPSKRGHFNLINGHE